ncbi:MAG: thioredoxin family protein [Gaiellaceae bacterium]
MLSVDLIARFVVAAVLLWAGLSKLGARDASVLAPYGVPARLRGVAYAALAAAELAVGILLLTGAPGAPLAALGLGVVFVAALAFVRSQGVRTLACGCFGARERNTDFLLVRAALFAGLAAFGAFGDVEVGSSSREALVAAALAVLGLAVLALGALVLALYRQVGVLAMRLGPGVALELAEEGPAVGEPAPALDGLRGVGPELVAFFSANCRLCRELAPGVRALEREGLTVSTVYEADEPGTFERWAVPGTPFFVHVVDGFVAAKGTANSLEQLDGLLAVGAARMDHAAA